MADSWYEAVPGNAPLLQGDFILNCPLLAWTDDAEIKGENEAEELSSQWEVVGEDVLVMTQGCDLEQNKVSEIVVCSMHTLAEVRELWEKREQNPNEKGWRTFFTKIRSGHIWNYTVLNKGEAGELQTDHRIVDFHNIATIPIKYLNTIAERRGPRLRLRSPYCEHLSQSFARYFMRVGLPVSVDDPW